MGSAPPHHPPLQRRRWVILLALGTVILCGLTSRAESLSLPIWISRNAGDALWTTALYLTLAFLRPRTKPKALLLLALAGSLTVELSQLWHTEWLDALRTTLPGKLLLGQGWQWADLPRYLFGGLLAFTLDRIVLLDPGPTQAPG